MLKATREKQLVTYMEAPQHCQLAFQQKLYRREWHDIVKALKGGNLTKNTVASKIINQN